jgi:hypothetical protein
MKITRDDVVEFEVHKFIADASDLGWRPGEWPRCVSTDLGNSQPLWFDRTVRNDDGSVQHVVYRQALGCIDVSVYNS